jgi:hypothetical protein
MRKGDVVRREKVPFFGGSLPARQLSLRPVASELDWNKVRSLVVGAAFSENAQAGPPSHCLKDAPTDVNPRCYHCVKLPLCSHARCRSGRS